jgi:hypothetical protein
MQQFLKALRGAARAEVVPTELLSQLLVAVHDPDPRRTFVSDGYPSPPLT